MKIKDLPKVERPRERLEKYGPEKLSTSQLLAVLLRTGQKGVNVVELASHIVNKFGTQGLANATLKDLREIKGLGKVKAGEILSALELGRRVLQNKKSEFISTPQDVWEMLKDIRDNKKEHFVVFFLDTRNQEIKREIISVGTLNASLVHPREVFEPAIAAHAAHVIVAHNHPSGNPEPSEEDIELTRRLGDAGKLLGIELLDHVIVTKTGFLSLREKKLM